MHCCIQLEFFLFSRETDAKFAAFIVNKPQRLTTGAECTESAEALTGAVEPEEHMREGAARSDSAQAGRVGTRDLFIDTAVYTRNRCVFLYWIM